MKAIVTKYMPATERLPTRIEASDADGNEIRILASPNSHEEAARLLCEKMSWTGLLQSGWLSCGSRVWVWLDKDNQLEV